MPDGSSSFTEQHPSEIGPVKPLPKPDIPSQSGLEKITVNNLMSEAKIPPAEGETVIVLQRNAKDDRSPEASDFGALEPNAAEQTRANAVTFFNEILEGLSPEERKNLDVLVIAGDNSLKMPDGRTSPHKRAVETAELVLAGARQSLFRHSLQESQVLNSQDNTGGKPIETSSLTDLRMLDDSPEFVEFMKNKYGTGTEFWVAYEGDVERETRIQMGAEGPAEIAQRVNYFVSLQTAIAKEYHTSHPGRRLVIWGVGAYDSISPYVKEYVAGMDASKEYLGVENGGGLALRVSGDGTMSTRINGNQYSLNASS